MSDDEQTFREDSPVREATPEERDATPPPKREPPKPKPMPEPETGGLTEAQLRIEEKKQKDKQKMEEEIHEYEEMRKEEREVIDKDIAELREKRLIRKQERLEEERLLAVKRQEDDQKRRDEEEERTRVKREQEQERRDVREKAQHEAEERNKNMGKRNFAVTRKSGSNLQDSGEDSKEEVTKSKEQLEAEKKAILEQRVQPLNTAGLNVDQLREKAKEIYNRLVALVGEKYDLENQCKMKNQEMSELAERARAMNKGRKQKVADVGSTDSSDPMSQKFAGAPPKIQLCSKYERHTDRRCYTERKDVFTGPIWAEETARIIPSWEEEGKPNPFEEAAREAGEESTAAVADE